MNFQTIKENIFFKNIDENNSDELSENVRKELYYFINFIRKAMNSTEPRNFGVKWKEDKRFSYQIFPYTQIKVEKPSQQIKVFIEPESYNSEIPFQNQDWKLVEFQDKFTLSHDSVILNLKDGQKFDQDMKLIYKGKTIKWEILRGGIQGRLREIEVDGKKITILKSFDRPKYYEIWIKESFSGQKKMMINGSEVNYKLIPKRNISKIQLEDHQGKLEFYPIDIKQNQIETTRKIKGNLFSENLEYDYKQIDQKHKNSKMYDKNGFWIILEDDNLQSFDVESKTKMDLFMDIVSMSVSFEIWEKPKVKFSDQEDRIQIKKIEKEDNRLLLKRLPTTQEIYPPDINYQLLMQKKSLETLMYRPSLEHRYLLRLFEKQIDVTWPEFPDEIKESDINFVFLLHDNPSTPAQKEFVIKALNCPDFMLLEGPPGSGKTTAITELIYQLLKNKKRVLLTSTTHVAVDNVLEKLVELKDDSKENQSAKIVPLRIGREERISEQISEFGIEYRMKKLHKHYLQFNWFNNLDHDNKNQFLTDMVCMSSNLVCGTSMGILQYPPIRNTNKLPIKPEFDYLVIDEASKTTFQEFLVPALHAKKCIIVGDIKQLSPYTDLLYAKINLDCVEGLGTAQKTALLALLKLTFDSSGNSPKYLYIDDNLVIQKLRLFLNEKIEDEKAKNPKHFRISKKKFTFILPKKGNIPNSPQITQVILEKEPNQTFFSLLPKIFCSDFVFICKGCYKKVEKYIPMNFLVIDRDNIDLLQKRAIYYSHNYWMKQNHWNAYKYRLPKGDFVHNPWIIREDIVNSIIESWAGEVAWRMKRIYELDQAKVSDKRDPTKFYNASLWYLLPVGSKKLMKEIKRVGRILFPSILSSMQTGVTKYYRDDDTKTVLSSGFDSEIFRKRHILLKYQNRMHGEISEIPRRLFYDNQALLDNNFVSREWNYPKYRKRIFWIDIPKAKVWRNSNDKEREAMFLHLREFQKWVKKEQQNTKNTHQWSVAFLTFYENQRLKLRDDIRKYFPNNNNTRKQTQFDLDGIKLYCYTIDKVQGREADVVFLSMVQTNRTGFMDCPNRLNVAMTRAKYQLVIFGNRNFYCSKTNRSNELSEIANCVEYSE